MTLPSDDAAAYVHAHVLPAAFALLPAEMDTVEARALLIAIGLQESRFQHRHQIGGPATGWWQFERGGGVRGVLSHRDVAGHLATACGVLRYPVRIGPALADIELHCALEDNDVLAAVFARLLLWTLPAPLPSSADAAEAWRQYLLAWRPGKPRHETWAAHYARAWALVSPCRSV